MKIIDVDGIGPVQAEKLTAAGVDTTDELLEADASRAGRDHGSTLGQRPARRPRPSPRVNGSSPPHRLELLLGS